MIQINRTSVPKVELIGRQKTPVIIIDNYAEDLSPVVEYAYSESDFQPDTQTYYPGVRSKLPKEYVVACLKPIMQGLYSVYQIPKELKPTPKSNYFSLITTQPDELTLVQSIPHIDTPKPYFFAVLHYLHDARHGGTGFFRHNPTGLERINAHQEVDYFEAANRFLHDYQKPTGFCNTSSAHYQLYHQVDYTVNRLVIYPGNLLHSVIVDVERDISAKPSNGRLTANMFIEFS